MFAVRATRFAFVFCGWPLLVALCGVQLSDAPAAVVAVYMAKTDSVCFIPVHTHLIFVSGKACHDYYRTSVPYISVRLFILYFYSESTSRTLTVCWVCLGDGVMCYVQSPDAISVL